MESKKIHSHVSSQEKNKDGEVKGIDCDCGAKHTSNPHAHYDWCCTLSKNEKKNTYKYPFKEVLFAEMDIDAEELLKHCESVRKKELNWIEENRESIRNKILGK